MIETKTKIVLKKHYVILAKPGIKITTKKLLLKQLLKIFKKQALVLAILVLITRINGKNVFSE